jgi:hypothetical protein
MSEPKRSGGAMLPLIIVGATLFGFGTYQSMRPKDVEVNKGFEAQSSVAAPSTPSPPNPRTMQAPDAPPMPKDAAARAAETTETTETTKVEAKTDGANVKLSISDAPWLQGIMSGAFGNFREGVLKSLKAEQAKGDVNCAPVLTNLDMAGLASLEKVTCTAKDGGQIKGEFDETGDGDLTIEDGKGGRVQVSKNDGDFNVETRDAQ